MGIKESLGEYFFGSRTKSRISRTNEIIEEYVADPHVRNLASGLMGGEKLRQIVYTGKYLPFLIEALSVGVFAFGIREDSFYCAAGGAAFLPMAEFLRVYSSRALGKKVKELEDLLRRTEESVRIGKNTRISRLVDSSVYPERN